MRRYKKDVRRHGLAAVATCIVLAWLRPRANEHPALRVQHDDPAQLESGTPFRVWRGK